jgi:hypothetical protein
MDPLVQRITARSITADVSVADLAKWEKDLRLMTKVYRSVGTEGTERDHEMWDEAERLFKNFRERLEKWAYKTLLPYVKSTDFDKQPGIEKKIRSEIWTLLIALGGSLFPEAWDGQNLGDHETPKYVKSFHTLKFERDRNVKRYQRAFVAAFKLIEEFLTSNGGEVKRFETAEESYEVGGINVIVRNYGRTERNMEDHVETTIKGLRHCLDMLRRAGFGKATEGLTVSLDFDRSDLVAGTYTSVTDELVIYPLGMGSDRNFGTLIHEIGHRYWYKILPNNAVAYWTEIMQNRGVSIQKEDIHNFVHRVVEPLVKREFTPSTKELLRAGQQEARDEVEQAKFRELSTLPLYHFKHGETFDTKAYIEHLSEFNEGETVQTEEITDYANTNPAEAWAEAFRLYVTKGPSALGPWTLSFFKAISRAGGTHFAANMISNIAARHREKLNTSPSS